MRTGHPSIPAEALARQARLQSLLLTMEKQSPSLEPACLGHLRELAADAAEPEIDSWVQSVVAENLVLEACELCRGLRRGTVDTTLLDTLTARLAPLAARAQQLRSARWQLDTHRMLIRFSYEKADGALDLDDGDLHAIFLHAFRLEGLPILLDLGKRPRPLLSVGLPLPAGVGGLAESMDAVLRREPAEPPEALMARLNRRLPTGVRLHQWKALPECASPVGDLALRSLWHWEVPRSDRDRVSEQVTAFLDASHWPWDRGSSHPGGPVDLRALLSGVHWEEHTLHFSTQMGVHQALNPLKILMAILGGGIPPILGLIRAGVELKPDERLRQAERFQPKLKNMYEDAVLLGEGSNILLVDEDDDEPLVLG